MDQIQSRLRRWAGGPATYAVAVWLLSIAAWVVCPIVVAEAPAGPGVTCIDDDGDGYGVNGDPSCPAGSEPDCDDADDSVYPGAPEVCDGVSNDCDDSTWPSTASWVESFVSTTTRAVSSIVPGDVDRDGDPDVLAFFLAAYFSVKTIAWFENPTGAGSYWTEHPIATASFLGDALFAADLDDDGDLDLLVAISYEAPTVVWYENTTGDGSTWTKHAISTTIVGAKSVFASDVDGDGDLDVLSTSVRGIDTIAWYENTTGEASAWTEHVISTTVVGSHTVFAADVDGDGDVDVVTASSYDNTIQWHENAAGDGTVWVDQMIPTTRDHPITVFAADVDGDHDVDVLSASFADDTIAWYENTAGDGRLWTEHLISSGTGSAQVVVAADMDDDGDLDALSTASVDATIAWYENTAGDGSAWTEHVIPSTVIVGSSVFVADMDGDGDPDAGSSSADRVMWFRFDSVEGDDDGDGVAGCEGDCDDANPNCAVDCTDADADGYCTTIDCDESNPHCTVDCADGDGDGYCVLDDCDDAVVACTDNCAVNVDEDGEPDCSDSCVDLDGDEYGAAGGAGNTCIGDDCDDTNPNCALDCTDLDDDGFCVTDDCDDQVASCADDCATDADGDGSLACADCDDTNAAVFSGAPEVCDGVSNDCEHPHWPSRYGWTEGTISTVADHAQTVVAADLDEDGDLDALATSAFDDKVAWHENLNGDGSIWAERVIATMASAKSAIAADVDGDGHLDVVAGSEHACAWYENLAGDGSSWDQHLVSATGARAVLAADLNGDEKLDVMTAEVDNEVAWYRNVAGDGTSWARSVIATEVDAPVSLFAADIDGDGDLDALAAVYFDDKIAWYEKPLFGGASWTEHVISTSASGAKEVFAADVDEDGDMDVLSASSLDDKVAWYENAAGDGSTWTEREISTSAENANSVFAVDIDGDGDIDALSAGYQVTWHENTTGDGSAWAERAITTPGNAANEVFVADVDGDGDLDALSASQGDDEIAWYAIDAVDQDHDGDGSCSPEDCDDSNPLCDLDCTDGDGDGACALADCDESDETIWLVPSAIRGLRFEADKATLTWAVPLLVGSLPSSLVYDTIRSEDPTEFTAASSCVEFDDGADASAEDQSEPLPGEVYFYLVRAENGCGEGSIGNDSSGVPRPPARSCGP